LDNAKLRLEFIGQPTNVATGKPFSTPITVAVIGPNGEIDRSYTGRIEISNDKEPIPSELLIPDAAPKNSTPMRLRATAPGCEDAISNVFYVYNPRDLIKIPIEGDGSGENPPPIVFHYSTRLGLIGIIESQSVWATHIRFLNDSSEYSYTASLALKMADAIRPTIINPTEREAFERFLKNLSELEFSTHYFVFSLSEDGDLLSQWRAYGNPGDCYSLGFESEGIRAIAEANQGLFRKCIYGPAKQQSLLSTVMEDALSEIRAGLRENLDPDEIQANLGELQGRVNLFATYFKDQAFSEEAEWRLILPFELGKTLVKFRAGRSLVTPYVSVSTSLHDGKMPLDRIILGPSPHQSLDAQSIGLLCRGIGIVLSSCANSNAPYRAW